MGLDSLKKKMLMRSISGLTYKEQQFFLKMEKRITGFFNFLKPFVMGLATFFIFYRIKDRVGEDSIIFVQLTVIIIMMKLMLEKLSRLVD